MSNQDIIIAEIISNGIYTEDEVEDFLSKGMEPPVHTYQRWKDMGYMVRPGSHARIKTRLWKHKTQKDTGDAEAGGEAEIADDSSFYLAPAYLFTIDQVDRYVEVTA